MDNPIKQYWQIRLAELKKRLEENNFEVFIAETVAEVKTIVMEEILPKICSSWTITEKSYPKGRVKVILINEDLGF